MPEKFQDRLFRLKCNAYGTEKSVATVLMAMTDEQIEELFDGVLEDALQSGSIKGVEVAQ